MKFPKSPAQVYALVVGVESYGDGINELSGPALDALSFCQWLLGRGVPPQNIRCVLNLCANARTGRALPIHTVLKQIQENGVPVSTDPQRSTLEVALSATELLKFKAPPESFFCLYWSGHGEMHHVTQKRFLLTADATRADNYAIDLEHQVNSLRLDTRLKNFQQQLIVVDACSKWTRSYKPPIALSLSLDHFEARGREQERVFASTNGEAAIIQSGASQSLFTQHLIATLDPNPAAEVDFDVVWDTLKRDLSKTEYPIDVRRFPPEGNDDQFVGGRNVAVHARTERLVKLVQASKILTVDILQRDFRRTTGCDSDFTLPVSSRGIIDRLDSFAAKDASLTNEERFALRLLVRAELWAREPGSKQSDRDGASALVAALNTWLQDSDGPAVNQEKPGLQRELQRPPRAFIDLGEHETRVWAWIDKDWELVDRSPKDNDIVKRIESAWQAAIKAGMATQNCHLELAAYWEDLERLPVGIDLSKAPVPVQRRIGAELPYTIRIRDRWDNLEMRNNWKAGSKWVAGGINGSLDWLDSRPVNDRDRAPQPDQWVSLHDFDDQEWQKQLLIHIYNGAQRALACRPLVDPALRGKLNFCAANYTVDEWLELARDVAGELKRLPTTQAVMLVADSPSLPHGCADFLSTPN
jgi:hypothetical protein